MPETVRRLARNPSAVVGVALVGVLVLAALFAPWLTPYDPTKQALLSVLQAPSGEHLLGTDQLGRDLLARLLYGGRLTLFIGVFAVAVGMVVGVPLGVLAGYYRGWVDMLIMRVMDLMLSFTSFLLAMALVALLGVGLTNVIIAVGIATIPRFARLVRSSVLTIREISYVEASHALGARDGRILSRHVMPNAVAPVIVQATLSMGSTVLTAAGLGFLGLGVQPPTPEWGAMLGEGRNYIFTSAYVTTFPGLAIFVAVLGFNLLGDGLRDALDPQLRGAR
ncbi:MAG: ABC transporter permease subunit [Deinococcus-Thermus bacterium]|jgi:ABC-type dipeptide/oligopeptide/nickel transport system permease subunit|nr:ABC transporter permease subunit [Deinococcota bacterium]